MIVAIDDLRECKGADVIIRSPGEAVELLFCIAFNIRISELWLDHDLGEGADIRELLVAIEENIHGPDDRFDPRMRVRILSDNPVGRKYIRQALERYFEVLP